MPLVGLEPAIQASETHVLDRAATVSAVRIMLF